MSPISSSNSVLACIHYFLILYISREKLTAKMFLFSYLWVIFFNWTGDWLTDWTGLDWTDWLIDWLRFHIQVNTIKVMLKCYIITFEFVELLPNFRLMQTQTLLWASATERFSKPLTALISPSPRAGWEGVHILKFGSWMQTTFFCGGAGG